MPHQYLNIAELPDGRTQPKCTKLKCRGWVAPIFDATDYEGPQKACDEHMRECHPKDYARENA